MQVPGPTHNQQEKTLNIQRVAGFVHELTGITYLVKHHGWKWIGGHRRNFLRWKILLYGICSGKVPAQSRKGDDMGRIGDTRGEERDSMES